MTDYKSMQARLAGQGASELDVLKAVLEQKERYIAALESRIDAVAALSGFNQWLRVLDKTTGATILDRKTDSVTLIFYKEKPSP